jgi:hypothetical protein
MYERRGNMRLNLHFMTKLVKHGLPSTAEGMIENVSQKGALTRTKSFNTFHLKDKVIIVFLVPSSFSDHNMTICLSDVALVIRIDKIRATIAIKFDRNLRSIKNLTIIYNENSYF